MSYHPPVGSSWEDFYKKWYIASFFGENRGSYIHSGDDLNLKTGGDSDLGENLYACSDGEITGVDLVSATGFGKQIFLKFELNDKSYWAMYAHCQEVLVRAGDKVKPGKVVGKLGKSGTSYAHLHFSIKNTPNGMDNVPNNKNELKQWENPSTILKTMQQSIASSQEEIVPNELIKNLKETLEKYKDLLDFGPDKSKLSQIESDPNMIKRIFDEMYIAKSSKEGLINQLNDKIKEIGSSDEAVIDSDSKMLSDAGFEVISYQVKRKNV